MPYVVDQERCRDFQVSSNLEWILPNGIGGFAMGTVSGANTRRYHGLLVAATKPPAVRTVLLSSIETYLLAGGQTYGLSTNQYVGAVHPQGHSLLTGFAVADCAEWTWDCGGREIALLVVMAENENTVALTYENRSNESVQLTLRPLVCHKFYHDNFRLTDFYPEFLVFPEDKTVLSHQGISLTLLHPQADRTPTTGWYYRFEHKRESERGLDPIDDLFCPCELRYLLGPGESTTLVATDSEPSEGGQWPSIKRKESVAGSGELLSQLESAARIFVVRGGGRASLIAGYPWFTDWGRDTMISLPGVCLETGHVDEARSILSSYANEMYRGLVPNRFVDRGETPDYNTVDGTLWFANACHQTLDAEWHEEFAIQVQIWLSDAYEWHERGTLYGIRVDQEDGLLTQGEPGVQLTWMDAKVGDWVVTPRHGKPVEVNGLWCNFLAILEQLNEKIGKPNAEVSASRSKAFANFDEKFWRVLAGHYLDTADPDDATLRPNQVIAMSLPFSPCDPDHARLALQKVRTELVTPRGLRTLGPKEPAYHGRFQGTLAERDAAYHQGTVWPWLIGAYVAATLRFAEDPVHAEAAWRDVANGLNECGLGGVSEVYDGDTPQLAGGCPWQAWSIAEVLRAGCMLAKLEKRSP